MVIRKVEGVTYVALRWYYQAKKVEIVKSPGFILPTKFSFVTALEEITGRATWKVVKIIGAHLRVFTSVLFLPFVLSPPPFVRPFCPPSIEELARAECCPL